MLTTFLSWIYITFLCWTWGKLFLLSVRKITNVHLQPLHFSVICITGLSVITIIAGILSLIIPLNSWWVQLLFIAPCLVLFLKKRSSIFSYCLKKRITKLSFAACYFIISLFAFDFSHEYVDHSPPGYAGLSCSNYTMDREIQSYPGVGSFTFSIRSSKPLVCRLCLI